MKFVKSICLALFVMLCLGMVGLSASAEDTAQGNGTHIGSHDALYVGSVKVTPENQDDILGDGTASYDPSTTTLTLRNYTSTKGIMQEYTIPSGETIKNYFSVYGGGNTNWTVRVEGKCTFYGGIVLERGEVIIEDARVTFEDNVAVCVDVNQGRFIVLDSKVKVKGISGLNPVQMSRYMTCAFYAYTMRMEDSTISCTPAHPKSDYRDYFLYAYDSASFINCHLVVDTPFPLFSATFASFAGGLNFLDCEIDLKGQEICFVALGEDNDLLGQVSEEAGFIVFDKSRIDISSSSYGIRCTDLAFENSLMEGKFYYDAIAIMGASVEDRFIIKNARLELSRHTFSYMKRHMWKPYWEALSERDQTEYGSYDDFLTMIHENKYGSQSAISHGIYVLDGALFLDNSNINIKGYQFGVFLSGQSALQLRERCVIRLSAEKAAFMVVSSYPSPMEEQATYKANAPIAKAELPESAIESLGTHVITFTEKGKSLTLNGTYTSDNQNTSHLYLMSQGLDGTATSLVMRTEGATMTWLYVVLTLAVLLLVVLILYFVIIRRQKLVSAETDDDTTPSEDGKK